MATYKEVPDFGLCIAEQALRRRFEIASKNTSAASTKYSLQELLAFCKLEPHESNLYQYYLRLQRGLVDLMVVDTVLSNLPEDRQKFIHYKYELGKSNVWISTQALYINEATLIKWNREILLNIKNLLFYSLTIADVYSVMKVINMIHILDVRINTFNDEKIPVDESWLHNLIQKRSQYKAMLNIMLESIRLASQDTDKKDTYNYIVAAKLKNSHLNGTELAQYCGVSCSTVTKHLSTYRQSMRKYISQAS